MAKPFVPPKVPHPHRVILLGAARDGWFDATNEERSEQVLPRFQQMLDQWKEMGARVIATLDDDLFMVGPPGSPDFTWYLMFEVPDLDTLAAMLQCVRESVEGVRLDKYIRIEARFGRPFYLLEGAEH